MYYYSKHPFLRVGLPFLTAIVVGTFLLADIRKSRYEHARTPRIPDNYDAEGDKSKKKNMKSLEEELKEWEEKHRKKMEEAKNDYEMKPVKRGV